MSETPYIILLFYKFVELNDPEALCTDQKSLCTMFGLHGRILIAREGINGTLEGTSESIARYKAALREDTRFSDIAFKESAGTGVAFTKLEIKVRPEVVTLGAGTFDIASETAPEITAEELESLYASGEDFVVLDLRNDYEIESGKFEKTVHPNLRNFRDLPAKMPELAALKNKKVVTVCTGGIRCEKATCLLKREGFDNVYQLKDGIHTYMEKYPGSHFKGTLFVFDNRMTTPVVEGADREVIGSCQYCREACEDYYSDDRFRPSLKVLCCGSCISQHAELRTA